MLICKSIVSERLEFLKATKYELDHLDELNNLKNFSLYTSIYKNDFRTPKEIITDSNLKTIEFRALTRYNAAKSYIKNTLPHLDKLRKYMTENPNWHDNVLEEYLEMFNE